MENQTSTETTSSDAQAAAAGIADRLKEQAKLVRARVEAAPAEAKKRWETVQDLVVVKVQQAFEKVRGGLDLPSRKEVTSLVARIEELDRKLAELETRETAKKRRKDGEQAA